jgi:glycosyltransferase involved in cell wall biosynthesis
MVPPADVLVSVGLPVRNGAQTLPDVISSVLAQDHERLELVICDNASTDGTEDVCRNIARRDRRVVYYRHSENVGLLNNFVHAMRLAKGTFFRWIGDGDRLSPNYISRCLGAFTAAPRLILVTTGIRYRSPDGKAQTYPYCGTKLQSGDPVDRFGEFLRSLLDGMTLDPAYGLMRRDAVVAIPRRNMILEDEVFATRLALAGPWSHIPEVLAERHFEPARLSAIARKLGVPAWQTYVSTSLQCREMLRLISETELTASQRRRARVAVGELYMGRLYRRFRHRGRKLARMVTLG